MKTYKATVYFIGEIEGCDILIKTENLEAWLKQLKEHTFFINQSKECFDIIRIDQIKHLKIWKNNN